jgi:uncharacterized UBP type Zn finger protein
MYTRRQMQEDEENIKKLLNKSYEVEAGLQYQEKLLLIEKLSRHGFSTARCEEALVMNCWDFEKAMWWAIGRLFEIKKIS